MNETETQLPPRLNEIVEDFNSASGPDKLEMLLEYSDALPALPDNLKGKRDAMEKVHECMTPVFMHAEARDGGLHFFFDISPESPTVRGYAGLLREGVEGVAPEEILRLPGDLSDQMGLSQVLTPQRLNGIRFILAHMKRLAAQHL